MNIKWEEKKSFASAGRLGRRVVALTLALSMIFSTAAFGWADDRIHPSPAEPGEAPTITVEANAVVDRWYDPGMGDATDYLTGELEVAIRVKSGVRGGKPQGFNTLSLALKYDPILTPYEWSVQEGWSDPAVATPEGEVILTNTDNSFKTMTNVQTLKNNKITTAVGHISGVKDQGGYLYVQVASNRPVVLAEDAVLAVVRFKYFENDLSELQDKLTARSLTIGAPLVKNAADWMDPVNGLGLIQFATLDEINGNRNKMELRYESANEDATMGNGNGMFYSADPTADACASMEVTMPDGSASRTQNLIPLNQTTYTPDAVKANQVNFTLANKTTYNDGGLSLDDLATVLFYDWDDTLLGVVIVPKDGDARKMVNDYVRSHFIYSSEDAAKDLVGNTNYSSLERKDTYRGKYPSFEPMEDGKADTPSTIVENGGDYALTNKLDYVFFKRPMEQVMTTNAEGKEVPTGQWKQKYTGGGAGDGTGAAAETAIWDDDYPYLHGWAIVPDYRHPEKVWTTLGVGELSSYSGTTNGGYKDIGTAPATVTPTDDKFKFADFDFRAKNHNSQEAGSIYAVKAVYEPGTSLLTMGNQYRMISEPYYNKLNRVAASVGGAYSVDVTFERASTEVGAVVRGVARMREPYVRQDTTTDLLWEQAEDGDSLKVDHNLPSPTYTEAYSDKTKTTYTKVEVQNVEEVSFSLTLSARQNKVDYYLAEGYGSNFVSGSSRTDNDSNRSERASTMDNYNYFVVGEGVDGSDEFDVWYDASYEDREGSRGFVLTGTLNQLMELATQCADGEIDRNSLYSYLTAANLSDVNILLPGAVPPTSSTQRNVVLDAMLKAVEAARPANNGGSTKYWNVKKNCAQLTYHQLQGFILDSSLNHDESPIVSGSTVLLTWCHLHKDCVDAVSTKPKTWVQLIDAARNHPEYIDGLTLNEMEVLAHLRADSDGTPFTTVTAFRNAIVRAVTGTTGTLSWDQVQAAILGETLPALEERNYWWYDGSTSVPLSSLYDTVTAAQDAITAVELPDGTTSVRYDKINQLRSIFEENNLSPTVTRAWNNATKNLCNKPGEGTKFSSFRIFRTAFVAAVQAANTNGATLEAGANESALRAYWQKLQYHILHDSYADTDPEMADYWWYDGNSKIGDLASLLAAAQRQVALDKEGKGEVDLIFDLFKLNDLYSLKDMYFRQNFHGDRYTDVEAFKDAVKDFVQMNGVTIATPSSTASQKANSWNQLQYSLIHPGCNFRDSATVDDYVEEIAYYWWRDGKDGEVYHLAADATDSGIETLMDAIYRYEANGNPMAYDELDAAAMLGFRLIPEYNAEETWDDLVKYGDGSHTIDALKTTLGALYSAIPAGTGHKTITWRQIQHYLLTNTYLPANDSTLPSDDRNDENGYWWREGDKKPAGGEKKTNLEYLLEAFDEYLNAEEPNMDALTGIDTESGSALDQYLFSGRLGIYSGFAESPVPMPEVDSMEWIMVRFAFTDIATYLRDEGYTTVKGVLDWYVIQYYAMYNDNIYGYGDPLVTPEDALDYYINVLNGDWVPNDYKADGMSLARRAFAMMAQRPDTTVETDPDTGMITVTTIVKTELENGCVLTVVTVTELDPETNQTVTTTTTTLRDEDGNELSTTETKVEGNAPVVPEEPIPSESPAPTETAEPTPGESPAPGETTEPDPSESPAPTETVEPTPSESPAPSETEEPDPSGSPAPSETEEPTPSESPAPSETEEPAPSESPAPSETEEPMPSGSPAPGETDPPEESGKEELETMPEVVTPSLSKPGGDTGEGDEEQKSEEPASEENMEKEAEEAQGVQAAALERISSAARLSPRWATAMTITSPLGMSWGMEGKEVLPVQVTTFANRMAMLDDHKMRRSILQGTAPPPRRLFSGLPFDWTSTLTTGRTRT